jgi:hypothetical protein
MHAPSALAFTSNRSPIPPPLECATVQRGGVDAVHVRAFGVIGNQREDDPLDRLRQHRGSNFNSKESHATKVRIGTEGEHPIWVIVEHDALTVTPEYDYRIAGKYMAKPEVAASLQRRSKRNRTTPTNDKPSRGRV